jgi:hypothetical protein
MFDAASRYYHLPVLTHTAAGSGAEPRSIRYASRRFLPDPATGTSLTEYSVVQGDRLDNLAARALGDPLLFWRIADANVRLEPETLCDEPRSRVLISLPSA